jgi:uncharacterized membrane protein YccC
VRQLHKFRTWDFTYALNFGIACLITYWVTAHLLPYVTGKTGGAVGILWAVTSTTFVYKDTRSHSFAAAMSSLIATLVSLALCLAYLYFFTASPSGMAILVVLGTLAMTTLGRLEDVGSAGMTTAIVMIVAANDPENASAQPWLRLIDTVVGIAVGVACKWLASLLFYKVAKERVR